MLTPKLPENQKALDASPHTVRIVLAEDHANPLVFALPPIEDLREIDRLRQMKFSVGEFAATHLGYERAFDLEYGNLRDKELQFSSSPIYWNRLATLAALAGRHEAGDALVERAYSIDSSLFYAHRFGEAMLQRDGAAAEIFYSSLNLEEDVGANLRLAAFSVKRRDFLQAERFIERALEIDPFDYGARLFDGGMSLFKQRYRAAVHSFRIALRERPTSSVVHYNLAVAYWGLEEEEKAFSSLKRAVALNPLDVNALLLLADIAFLLNRVEDSIPSLRYYVQHEQQDSVVWSRLARACHKLGIIDGAIDALKREASLKDSPAVWNNLGVSHMALGSTVRALEAFAHAMRLDEKPKSRSYFLAARNIANHLSATNQIANLRAFVAGVLAQDSEHFTIKDVVISDIWTFYIHALLKQREIKLAQEVSHEVLGMEGVADSLVVWIVSALVSFKALFGGEVEDVARLALSANSKAADLPSAFSERKERYFNNVAFALAETGDVDRAMDHLMMISQRIHKSPYPTATLGLIKFRKGDMKRAVELYEEAILLASGRGDRVRIKQKLNLELGKYYYNEGDRTRAERSLERAAKQRFGEDALASEAQRTLMRLRESK
jgi:tetratricopeptide (TPR) repeat protein